MIEYTAPPTIAAFAKSRAYGRIIAGPVGSGKTTGCVMECLRRSMEQSKADDGFRYTRFAFVRQTLKQLKDTVLKDIQNWLVGLGEWKVSENTYYLEFADVKSEWLFIPLEEAADQARLLSSQLTGCWINEAIECNFDILAPISGRIGRYPSGNRGAPTWYGIISDTNMPTEMSDWHRFMIEPPPNWQVFIQPGGMAADAENLNWVYQTEETKNLPVDHPARLAQGRRYYENFLEMYGNEHPWVKRYVDAEYGEDPAGEAVFRATFNSKFHVVDETLVIPGYPILVGQDFGRNPWSIICQLDHLGRLLVHEEVPGTNIGLEKHVEQHLRPKLYNNKYIGNRSIIVGDPAGAAKGTIAEETSFDALKRLGFSAFPAPSNDIDVRLRAVEALLGKQVNGGPAICFSRQGCPWLIRAMSGGYRFQKIKQGGALRAIPDKTQKEGFDHVADALQYACLTVHANLMPYFLTRANPRKVPERSKITAAGWT